MSAGVARLVVAVAVAVLAVLELVLPAPVPAPGPVTDDVLVAGAATCAVLDGPGESDARVLAVAGPAVLDDVATAELSVERDGEVVQRAALPTASGVGVVRVDDQDGPLASARWRGVPVVVGRSVRSVGDADRPGGLVEGRCPGATADRWVVPGLATAGGASATLHLANPSDDTATARIVLTTPLGTVEPTRLNNVVVPPHATVELDVGEFAPEEPDVGVVVELAAGRVTVEAVQRFAGLVSSIDGASLVRAATSAAEEWVVPFLRGGGTTTAWLWVTNPGDRPTDVRVVLHRPDGPTVPIGTGVTVAPGETRRLSLAGQLPGEGPVSASVAADDGAAIVVSGAVAAPTAEDAVAGELEGVGFAVVPGVPASDAVQVAMATIAPGRTTVLHVANPSAAPVAVRVRLFVDGVDVASPGLSPLVVPAGGHVAVPVERASGGGRALAVVLQPQDGPVAAALASSATSGALDLVVDAAGPFPSSRASVPRPAAVPDPGLVTRSGTPFGPGTG